MKFSMNLYSLANVLYRDFRMTFNSFNSSLEDHISAAMEWLALAQDITGNNGVSRRYSLIYGWDSSYPETTGYIIPTFLKYYELTKKENYKKRAIKMVDWELSIQKSDGSFPGGAIGEHFESFVFDTGQIIFGLIEAFKYTGEDKYIKAAKKAGDWIVDSQDGDGAWRRFAFYRIPHTYYTRVAWALSELFLVVRDKKYELAARKNIEWTLKNQCDNGWFNNASFRVESHGMPNTHTIAYTIRGILEAGICLNEGKYIIAAQKSADALLNIINSEGFFWATYNKNWKPTSTYSCLTGNAQISIILLRLFQVKKNNKYLETAKMLNKYLRLQQNLKTSDKCIYGAIAGSYPIWGKYQKFAYPNWATKFFVDTLILENEIGK